MECLRPAPDNLRDHFRKVARRKVAKDRSITFKGRLYEVPVDLIGKQIEVLYHEKDCDHIEVRYQNRSYGLVRAVNLNVNCRVKRDESNKQDIIITASHTDYKGGKLL